MNEEAEKSFNTYRQMMEAHDAEVEAKVRAELRDRLTEALSCIYLGLDKINDLVGATPSEPPAKRKRSPTVATKEQVEAVQGLLREHSETIWTSEAIATQLGMGPRFAANVCRRLFERGAVKHIGGKGYQYCMPPAGPVMIDSIKEPDGLDADE